MRVQVLRLEVGEAGPRVALKTPGGVFWAYWRGEPPTRGAFTDVELAIAGVVEWGRELTALSGPGGDGAGGAALECLNGTLEHLDADGTATVRVGGDAVLVATRGRAPALGTGVRLRGCEIAAYPAHL